MTVIKINVRFRHRAFGSKCFAPLTLLLFTWDISWVASTDRFCSLLFLLPGCEGKGQGWWSTQAPCAPRWGLKSGHQTCDKELWVRNEVGNGEVLVYVKLLFPIPCLKKWPYLSWNGSLSYTRLLEYLKEKISLFQLLWYPLCFCLVTRSKSKEQP